jgi:hypothetical protein
MVMALAALGPGVAVLETFGTPFAAGVVGLVCVALTLGAGAWLSTQSPSWERRWLDSLPIGLDTNHYVEQLSRALPSRARLHVRVEFAEPVPEKVHSRVTAAALQTGGAEAIFEWGTLLISSPSMQVCFGRRDRGTLTHSNRLLHDWFRNLVRGLLVIHGRHPIARVSVKVG